MRGNPGKRLRKERAIERIDQQILGYEVIINQGKDDLKIARSIRD